jgi:hypothetical protein
LTLLPARNPARRRRASVSLAGLGAQILGALILGTGAAPAQDHASLSFRGLPGLIDMPSAASLSDADVSLSLAGFGPVIRTTLGFQISPRIEFAFRYNSIGNWGGASNSYYDANFDLRYRLIDANGWVPAVVVGLQDFVGNGLDSAEYIVATAPVGQHMAVSAGLGWGRFGSFGALFSTGNRTSPDLDNQGRIDLSQYFRGDVSAFGGLEWQISDRLTAKAEYSSDAYAVEAGSRGAFDRASPWNFGLEYRVNPALTLGTYSLYGTQIGFSASMVLNAKKRIAGPLVMSGPETVAPRPDRAGHPDDWTTDWVDTPDAAKLIREAIGNHLERTGIVVESVSISGDTVQVRYRNKKLDAEAQAIGRVARAMSQVLPASVEVFQIVPMVKGMPATMATIRRSDLEALEFAPGNDVTMRQAVTFGPAAAPSPLESVNPQVYPALRWSIGPYARVRLFDDVLTPSADAGLRAEASYEFAPGFVLSGAVTKTVAGTLNASPASPSPLPPVRRDVALYDTQGDPAIERATAAWYAEVAPDVYSRLTFGLIERMFGGVSGEVLYRPTGRPWALGVEADYVAQRDPSQGLGFSYYDYRVATGMVSGYLDMGGGYHARLDLGRYLAGDWGGTLTLTRELPNGWKFGAFATLTNVSPADFGDGSFDKGVMLEIPMSWLLGTTSRTRRDLTLRPFDRDGGAQLDVDGRLYDVLHAYDLAGIDAQWGRFWR